MFRGVVGSQKVAGFRWRDFEAVFFELCVIECWHLFLRDLEESFCV